MKSTGRRGCSYIVMSYVDGKSLADQFAERKTPLPVKQAILIVAEGWPGAWRRRMPRGSFIAI